MSKIYQAIIYGPAGVQGSKIPIVNKKTGKAHLIEASKGEGKGRDWRQMLIREMELDQPEFPIDDAAYILIKIFVSRPRSHYSKSGQLKPNSPKFPKSGKDWDKVGRSASDASKIAKLVFDDARFADAHVQRRYTADVLDPERVEVFIYNLEELGPDFLNMVLARVTDGHPIEDHLISS